MKEKLEILEMNESFEYPLLGSIKKDTHFKEGKIRGQKIKILKVKVLLN